MCDSGLDIDKQGNLVHRRSGEILKVWVEDNKFTGAGHHIEPLHPVEQKRKTKKKREGSKEKEPDFKNDMFVLCKNIFKKDKTPAYTYTHKKSDEDKFGNYAGNGKRWLTPSEMVLNFVRENFPDREQELFDENTEVPNSSQ